MAASGVAESDAETRISADHHEALRLWLRLLATTNLIESRVRQALHEHFGTTLPRFDLMAQLDRVPNGLHMGELSRRMMVTGGNVTGIADSLEREGLVARNGDPKDRRALRLRLTPMGRKAFRAMTEAHERWIVDAFAALDTPSMTRLAELLGRVKTHLRATQETR